MTSEALPNERTAREAGRVRAHIERALDYLREGDAQNTELCLIDAASLCELELADQARADDERCDAPVHAVIRSAVRQGGTVRCAAPNHSAAVHVMRCIAWVQAPRV